jgi:hypothetical protein
MIEGYIIQICEYDITTGDTKLEYFDNDGTIEDGGLVYSYDNVIMRACEIVACWDDKKNMDHVKEFLEHNPDSESKNIRDVIEETFMFCGEFQGSKDHYSVKNLFSKNRKPKFRFTERKNEITYGISLTIWKIGIPLTLKITDHRKFRK